MGNAFVREIRYKKDLKKTNNWIRLSYKNSSRRTFTYVGEVHQMENHWLTKKAILIKRIVSYR